MSDTKRVLKLALPAALKHLLDILQTLVDLLMVGTISSIAIASVGVSLQLIAFMQVFITLFATPASILIARYVGAKSYEMANKTLFNILTTSFLVSLPLMYILTLYSKEIFLFIGTSQDVATLGSSYFNVIASVIPIIFLDTILFNAFSGAGDTKTPFIIKIFSTILNIFLNYLLIFGNFGFPELGVEGAGIATAIAYGFSLFCYIIILVKHKKLNLSINFDFEIIKKVFKFGFPTSLERSITYSSYIIFLMIIASFGDEHLAGYQVGLRVEAIAFMPGFGFTIAAMSLIGQNIGAKNYDLALSDTLLVAKIASILMGFLGLFMIFIPEFFCSFFTNDIAVIESASIYLVWVGLSQIPLALAFVMSGALRGAGATRLSLYVNVTVLWSFRIIPAYIFAVIFNDILYVYIVMCIETFIKGYVLYRVFIKGSWKNIKV